MDLLLPFVLSKEYYKLESIVVKCTFSVGIYTFLYKRSKAECTESFRRWRYLDQTWRKYKLIVVHHFVTNMQHFVPFIVKPSP